MKFVYFIFKCKKRLSVRFKKTFDFWQWNVLLSPTLFLKRYQLSVSMIAPLSLRLIYYLQVTFDKLIKDYFMASLLCSPKRFTFFFESSTNVVVLDAAKCLEFVCGMQCTLKKQMNCCIIHVNWCNVFTNNYINKLQNFVNIKNKLFKLWNAMRGWSSLVWSADFKSVGDETCSVVRFHLLRDIYICIIFF